MYKPKSRLNYALVAEQVDAADLKSVVRKDVPVRFRPSAPIKKLTLVVSFFVGMIYRVSNRHSAGLTTSESDTRVSRSAMLMSAVQRS